MARNFTISLPATAFSPLRGTVAAATVTSQAVTNSHRVAWACDDTATEGAASVPFVCPNEYTGSGALKANIFFASGTQNSGSAVFAVYVEAITAGADSLNVTTTDGFDSANTGTTDLSGSTAGDLLRQTVTLANKDSVAAGDQVRISFLRSVGGDSVSDDLYIYLIELFEET